MLFQSLCRSKFLIYHFPPLKNFKHFLQIRVPGERFPQFLLVWGSTYFSFTQKNNFSRHRILIWCCYFFQDFDYFTPFSSCLYAFKGDVWYNSYPSASMSKIKSLWLISRFSLCLWFSVVEYDVLFNLKVSIDTPPNSLSPSQSCSVYWWTHQRHSSFCQHVFSFLYLLTIVGVSISLPTLLTCSFTFSSSPLDFLAY